MDYTMSLQSNFAFDSNYEKGSSYDSVRIKQIIKLNEFKDDMAYKLIQNKKSIKAGPKISMGCAFYDFFVQLGVSNLTIYFCRLGPLIRNKIILFQASKKFTMINFVKLYKKITFFLFGTFQKQRTRSLILILQTFSHH